jgi:adenosylcobinamide-phosphate synthase
VLVLALLADALAGEPAALYARVPHPVALLGRLVAASEGRLRRAGDPPRRQRRLGLVLLVAVAGVAALAGALVERLLLALPLGWVWLALAASSLLAQRSLVDHVRAVADGLRAGGLAQGRRAVAMIVGRDPERLDAHGVAQAAVESLAENLSDGVVAPAFWFLLGGLPGLAAYKAVNTLDSMVGHRSERYLHFGRGSAKADDLANLVPARLTALLLLAVGGGLGSLPALWRRVARDARRHRSPNAGWPEAAAARLLGLRLAGPRVYADGPVDDAWMGDGRAGATPEDIDRAVRLAWRAWAAMLAGVGLLAAAL